MTISLIWAMDENGVIGKDNSIPWRLPRDMAFFKEQTIGKTVIMGRKTWESFGGKPLKDRRNVVLTRSEDYEVQGGEVLHSIDEGLKLAEEQQLMVIGGSEIYRAFLPHADQLIVTTIAHAFEGDTVFPEVDWTQWKLVSAVPGIMDDNNKYKYTFNFYERK